MAFGFLKKIAKFALPVVGTALGGPLGGAAGGALGGLVSGGGLKGAAGGALGGLTLGKLGGIKGVAGQLGKLSAGDLAQLGLAGAGAIASAQQAGKANAINQGVLNQLQAQEAQKAKVRDQLLGRLTGPQAQREDLGSLFVSDNPFARSLPRQGTQPAPTVIPEAPAPLLYTPRAFQGQELAMPNRGAVQNRLRRAAT